MTLKQLAQSISFILGQYMLLPVLILVSLSRTGLSRPQQILFAPLFLFLVVIFPTIVLYIMIKRNVISDWDIRKREERHKIFPAFMIGTGLATLVSYYFASALFFHLCLILLIVVFVTIAITSFWKISLHMVLNTSVFLVVNFLFNWKLPYLYFLIPVVGWARHYDKHHSLAQICAGIALSTLIILSGLRFFGYV